MSSKRLFTPLARNIHRRCISTNTPNSLFDFDAPPRPLHHRVVVTGLGLVTPFGVGVAETWDNILAGKSSIRALEPSHLPSVRTEIYVHMNCGVWLSLGTIVVQEHAELFDSLPSKVVGKVDHRHIGDILDENKLRGVDSKSPAFIQFACLAASEVWCVVDCTCNQSFR
jgi:3-oxoacyl-(acyl-carrier-protein) synthase